jgi:transcriptional regulator with XRE-family HTH domain
MVEKIRKLAKEKGLSITKLEEAVGLGNGTITKWDKGSPVLANLKKVADFLGVSIEDLI